MSAQVRSFDAIQLVRDELVKYAHRSTEGLEGLSAEIRHVIDWVEHDRPAYWKRRVSKAHDAVTEAKANLQRCLMYPINDEQPSCAEEKDALKKAQAHLQHCREKQDRVREWAQKLRHELHEYEGRTAKLRTHLEVETPRAIALLERTIHSLEQYASGGPPSGPSGGTATPSASEGDPGEAPPSEGPPASKSGD